MPNYPFAKIAFLMWYLQKSQKGVYFGCKKSQKGVLCLFVDVVILWYITVCGDANYRVPTLIKMVYIRQIIANLNYNFFKLDFFGVGDENKALRLLGVAGLVIFMGYWMSLFRLFFRWTLCRRFRLRMCWFRICRWSGCLGRWCWIPRL